MNILKGGQTGSSAERSMKLKKKVVYNIVVAVKIPKERSEDGSR